MVKLRSASSLLNKLRTGTLRIIPQCSSSFLSRFSDIFWIDSSSESTIDLTLKQIAKAKGLGSGGSLSSESALHWISGLRSNWLMVFDNADGNPDIIEKVVPSGSKGNILITSRNPQLKRVTLSENSVEVTQMTEDDAIALLMKSSGLLSGSKDIARRVVLKLGCIPLAVDQAGSYIQACQCTFSDYLELYMTQQDQLMSDSGFKGASGYGHSAFSTWEISMKEIESRATDSENTQREAAQSALILQRIFGFLHHENISEEIFRKAAECYLKSGMGKIHEKRLALVSSFLDLQTLHISKEGKWDKHCFLSGIRVLSSFSLIKKSQMLYTIHPLIHDWSRNRLSDADKVEYCSKTRAILSWSVEMDGYTDNYTFIGRLVQHVEACYSHLHELKLDMEYFDDEAERIASLLVKVGEYNKAGEMLQAMIEKRQNSLGINDEHTLHAMGGLAHILQYQKKWGEAEKLLLHLISLYKAHAGDNNKDTVYFMSRLANTYQNQHKLDEAEQLGLETVKWCKKHLGTDDLCTLSCLGNLGITYSKQRRWNEAEDILLQVIEGFKIKLGENHIEILTTMTHLPSIYENQGNLNKAENLQLQLLESYRIKCGASHPYVIRQMELLSCTYLRQGKSSEANQLLIQVVQYYKERYGLYHPNTLSSLGSLVVCYCEQGKWNEAMNTELEVIEGQMQLLGSNHSDTLMSMNNLAVIYTETGRYAEAEQIQLKLLDTGKMILGADHPLTITCMSNLATAYMEQGRWNKAEELQLQLMESHKAMGETHLDAICNKLHLAWTYQQQGRLNEAEELTTSAIESYNKVLGPAHISTLAFHVALAKIYVKKGELEKAKILLSSTINELRESVGESHPVTLTSIELLSSWQGKEERLDHIPIPESVTSCSLHFIS